MRMLKGSMLMVAVLMVFADCASNSGKQEKEKLAIHDAHSQPSGIGYADSVNNGLIVEDTLKGSPARMAMATVGKTHLHITYHSPGVKGRIVWGGLVPNNQVWVTGAHSATTIVINHPILINNQKIDTGTYAIFTIPGEKEWIFILNKNHHQHLADNYSEAEDVIRTKVIPQPNKMTPRLTYTIVETGNAKGNIVMEWEKIKLEIPFSPAN
jgi:Protein of unknown function (DUF2911)